MTLIREPLLRGVREVSAILFAGPTAADDVLVHWAAGATLLRTGDGGLVVKFATPVAWRCELGKGVPLIADEGRLVSLPLDRALLKSTPPDAIVRLHHGALAVEETTPSDPTGLLDLGTWHLEAPTTVTGPQSGPEPERGQRPPPPDPSMAVTPAEFDTSAKLGRRSAPTARDRRQWRLLQPRPTRPAGPVPTTPSAARPASRRPSGRTQTTSPLLDWLHKRRQRKYLEDLTRLFAAGDLDAALRKAIPFGGENGPEATRTPRPRANLDIKPHRTPSSGIVSIEPGLRASSTTATAAPLAAWTAKAGPSTPPLYWPTCSTGPRRRAATSNRRARSPWRPNWPRPAAPIMLKSSGCGGEPANATAPLPSPGATVASPPPSVAWSAEGTAPMPTACAACGWRSSSTPGTLWAPTTWAPRSATKRRRHYATASSSWEPNKAARWAPGCSPASSAPMTTPPTPTWPRWSPSVPAPRSGRSW